MPMREAAILSGAPVCAPASAGAPDPQGLLVRDLRLRLGETQVLDGVSLGLGARGCTVIMGPNGAGKSVLLRCMHGLIAADAGQVSWSGVPAADATARQAMVFQKPVLLRRSVAANVDFVLRARRKDRSRTMALLEHVGLADKARRPARALSGGEQQRLALARALALDPEVLLLDEPTASLDPPSVQMIEAIVTRARDAGTRIIMVTHDAGQARRLADDVVFLHRGRVAEHSAAQQFFPVPQSQAARDYLDGRIVV